MSTTGISFLVDLSKHLIKPGLYFISITKVDSVMQYLHSQFLTYGLLDMGLVEIHGNKGHLTANKGGIFCRYTRICWYFCHAVAHNQAGKFC